MMKIFYNQEFLSSISKIGSKVTIKDYRLSSYEESVGGLTRLFEESYIETLNLSPASGVYSFDSIWDSDDKKLYINLEVPELDTDILDPTKYKIIYVYYSDYYDTVSSKIAFVLIGDYKTDDNGRIVIEPLRLSLGRNLIVIDLSEEIRGDIETKLDEDTKFLESKGPDTGVNIYYALEKLKKMDESEEKTLYSQSLISIGSWESYIKDLQADDSSVDSSEISPYFDKNGIKVFNSFIYYEYTDLKIYFDKISDSETSKIRHLGGDREGSFSLLASVLVRVHMRKNGRDTVIKEYTDTNIQKTRISYQFKSVDSEGGELDNWTIYDENTNTLLYNQNPDALLGRRQTITAKFVTNVRVGDTISSDEIILVQEEGPLVFEIVEDNECYYFNEDILGQNSNGRKNLKILEAYQDDYVNFDIICNGNVSYQLPKALITGNNFNEHFTFEENVISDSNNKYKKRFTLTTIKKNPDTEYLGFSANEYDYPPICESLESKKDPVSGNIIKKRWKPFKIVFTATGNGKLNENIKLKDEVYSLQKTSKLRATISEYYQSNNVKYNMMFPFTVFKNNIVIENVLALDRWTNSDKRPTIPFAPESEKCKYYIGGVVSPNNYISDNYLKDTRKNNCTLATWDRQVYVTASLYDDELGIGNINRLFGDTYENEDYQMNLTWIPKADQTDLESDENIELTSFNEFSQTDKPRWEKETMISSGIKIESAGINHFPNSTTDTYKVIFFRSYLDGNNHNYLKGAEMDWMMPGFVRLIPKKYNLDNDLKNRRRWCISWYPATKFPTTLNAITEWDKNWESELEVLRVKVNAKQAIGENYILNQDTEEIVLKDFNAVPFYIKSNFNVEFRALNELSKDELSVIGDSSTENKIIEWWRLCKQDVFQAFLPDTGYIGNRKPNYTYRYDYNTGSLIYVRLKGLPGRTNQWIKNGRAQIGTLLLSGPNVLKERRIKVFFDMSDNDVLQYYPELVFNKTTENTGHIFLWPNVGTLKEVPIYTNRPVYLVDYDGSQEGVLGEVKPDDKGRGVSAIVGDEKYSTFVSVPRELNPFYSRQSRMLNLTHEYYDGDEAHGTKYKCSYFHIVAKTNNYYKDVPELMLMMAHTLGGFEEAERSLSMHVHQLSQFPIISIDDTELNTSKKIFLGYKSGNETSFSISYSYANFLQTSQNNTELFETQVDIVNDSSNTVKLIAKTENEADDEKYLGTLTLIPEAGTVDYEGNSHGDQVPMITVKLIDIFYDETPIPTKELSVYQQNPNFSIKLIEVDTEGNSYDSGSIIPPNGQKRFYKVDTNMPEWDGETIGSAGQIELIMDDEDKDVIWTIPDRNTGNKIYTFGEVVTQSEKLKILLKDLVPIGFKIYKQGNSGYYDKVSIKQAGYTKYIFVSAMGKPLHDDSLTYYMLNHVIIGKLSTREIWVKNTGEVFLVSAAYGDLEKFLTTKDHLGSDPVSCTFSVYQVGDYILPEENIIVYGENSALGLQIPPFRSNTLGEMRSIGVTVTTPKLSNGEVLELPLRLLQESFNFNIAGIKDLYYFADGELAKDLGNGKWGNYGELQPLVHTKIMTSLLLSEFDFVNNILPSHPQLVVKFYNFRMDEETLLYHSPLFKRCKIVPLGNNQYDLILSMHPNQGNYDVALTPIEGYLRFYTSNGELLDEIHILQGCANCYIYDEYIQMADNLFQSNAPDNPTRMFYHPLQTGGQSIYGSMNSPAFRASSYSTHIQTRLRIEIYENPYATTWSEIPRTFGLVGSFGYGQDPGSYAYPTYDFNVYNSMADGALVDLYMRGSKLDSGTAYFYLRFKLYNLFTERAYIYATPQTNGTEYLLGWWVHKPKR